MQILFLHLIPHKEAEVDIIALLIYIFFLLVTNHSSHFDIKNESQLSSVSSFVR